MVDKEVTAHKAADVKATAKVAAAEAAAQAGAASELELTDEEEVVEEIVVNANEKRQARDWSVNMGDACQIDEPGPPALPGQPDNPRTPITWTRCE